MPRSRLEFVPPGSSPGQIAEVRYGTGRPHTHLRDGPDGEPVEYTVPGMDTEIRLIGHPFLYGVKAIRTDDGPRVVELHIDSPEHDVALTPEDLRKLARLLDRLAYTAAEFVDPSTPAFHQPEKSPPKRPGRRGLGSDHYAEVAEIAKVAHRERHLTGKSVRQRIAEHYGVSEHTAEKYLARARAKGFLQPGELGGTPRKGTAG